MNFERYQIECFNSFNSVINNCTPFLQPRIENEYADEIDYDSSDSAVSDLDSTDDEEDVFDTNSKPKSKPKDNTEHSNSNSYSWNIMRFAIVKILQQQLQDFLAVAGIEMQGMDIF